MRMPSSIVLLQAVFAAAIYGRLLNIGYQRRKSVWTRRSWSVFALLLACAFAVLGLALRMAHGVDQGVYDEMSHVPRSVYFYTMFALVFLGVASSSGLVLWLAKGRPDRQLG
jgi:predicted outer membrane lipoprotein